MSTKKATAKRLTETGRVQLELISEARGEIVALKRENRELMSLIKLFVEGSTQAGEGQLLQSKTLNQMRIVVERGS